MRKILVVWGLLFVSVSAWGNSCQELDWMDFAGAGGVDWDREPPTFSHNGIIFEISNRSDYSISESDFKSVFSALPGYKDPYYDDEFYNEFYSVCHDVLLLYEIKNRETQEKLFVIQSYEDKCDGGNSIGFVLTDPSDVSTLVGEIGDSTVMCF